MSKTRSKTTAKKGSEDPFHHLSAEEIGAALRRRRKQLGRTQKEVAELMGVVVSTISQNESGERRPSLRLWLEGIPTGYSVKNPNDLLRQNNIVEKQAVVIKKGSLLEQIDFEGGLLYSMSKERVKEEQVFASIVTLDGNGESEETHHPSEEIIYILEGDIIFFIHNEHDEEWTLTSGDMVHFKSDHPHKIKNTKPTPAKMLIIRHPAR